MYLLGFILGIILREYGLGFLASENGTFQSFTGCHATMFDKLQSLFYSLLAGAVLGWVFAFMWYYVNT